MNEEAWISKVGHMTIELIKLMTKQFHKKWNYEKKCSKKVVNMGGEKALEILKY